MGNCSMYLIMHSIEASIVYYLFYILKIFYHNSVLDFSLQILENG